MNKRLHVYYHGSVQGVGFRFTAQSVAQTLGLSGWARNLRDGNVEAVLEGEEASIEKFLRKIAGIFGRYIKDVDTEWGEPTGEFDGFDIRF